MCFSTADIKQTHAGFLDEKLTVDINIAADVGAAKRVRNLAGHRLCKEGVVHNNLICVSRNLLDYTSPFSPPGVKIDVGREKKNEGKGENILRQVFHTFLYRRCSFV